jgi:EAL domain-containing protein (putative c-di-GMP-specific phosphodiesterase class I)
MDSELRKAVKNDELELNFQPKVEVATHRIKGVEALLRWNSRTMGPVSPYEFIALAEETGQIIEIGQWVVEQSCMVLKEWQGRFGMDLSLSLNLSARQFHNKGFLRMIRQAIFDSAVDPRSLTLEITESLLIDNVDHCMRTLSELKDTGASLSIDDFGTGYSSLSYLQRLPVDEIKIDKSFIADLETSVPSQAIASSVIYMSHNLGLTTVAEGVETEGQLEFLRTHACDTCQGFYFSRPLPKNGVEELIETVTSLMPISVNATE